MPENLGHSFSALEAQARERRMDLLNSGGVYTLQSVFGQRHYQSLADVAAAMRYGRY